MKIKQEAETAATAQKPKVTESLATLEPAEGGVVAEAAAAHNLGDGANEAATAHNLGDDANAAATKEKAKKTGDMPRSQNSKNEKRR